jgi:hypothetical protein
MRANGVNLCYESGLARIKGKSFAFVPSDSYLGMALVSDHVQLEPKSEGKVFVKGYAIKRGDKNNNFQNIRIVPLTNPIRGLTISLILQAENGRPCISTINNSDQTIRLTRNRPIAHYARSDPIAGQGRDNNPSQKESQKCAQNLTLQPASLNSLPLNVTAPVFLPSSPSATNERPSDSVSPQKITHQPNTTFFRTCQAVELREYHRKNVKEVNENDTEALDAASKPLRSSIPLSESKRSGFGSELALAKETDLSKIGLKQ